MRRITAALVAASVIITLIVAPADAHPRPHSGTAHAAPWRWKTVEAADRAVPAGAQADVIISCPSGYRPVSLEWKLNDLRMVRQAEYMDYSGNWGRALIYNPTTTTGRVTASLNCVYGADVGTISVTSREFAPSATTGYAGGFANCPALTGTMIGGGADWNSFENVRSIDISTPTSSGWYVRGHGGTGNLHVEVYCIALGYQTGMHIVKYQQQAQTSSVACPIGERVVSGGGYGYPIGGSFDGTNAQGKLFEVQQQHAETWGLKVEAATNPTTTLLVAAALCVPASIPKVLMYTAPSGDQASSSVSYSFTASDPAGEDLQFSCRLHVFPETSWVAEPCHPGTVANTVSGLMDGSYTLLIEATNESSQSDRKSSTFLVDTSPPTVTLSGKPSDPDAFRSAAFTLQMSDPGSGIGQVLCHLDLAPEDTCPGSPNYTNLTDGSHSFSWRVSDAVGNQTTGSYVWTVDSTAPRSSLTAPAAAFTQTSSATVRWRGADSGSGVASWEIQSQRAPYNGPFHAWSPPQAFSTDKSSQTFTGIPRGANSCFRVRATDGAGNRSSWSARRCTAQLLDDTDLLASANWTRTNDGSYYGGSAIATSQLNATLALTGAQLDRVAVLATTCPTCGIVGVYVGAQLVGAVDLHATTTNGRHLIALPAFGYRTGTVTLKVLTSGKLVRIDGLGVSRT